MQSNLHITISGHGGSRHTYTCVAARRNDHHWVVTCDEQPHIQTRARLLASAARWHRHSLAQAVAMPESAVTVVVYPVLPRRIHDLIEHSQALRVDATRTNHDAAMARQTTARALAAEQLSLRDIGTILGVSYQRAHQLVTGRTGGER